MLIRLNASSRFPLLGLATVIATSVLASASVAWAQSTYAIIHVFVTATDGGAPQAAVMQGSDGMLYGTTPDGGASGSGTVFRLAPDGSQYTVLHAFTDFPDGAAPLSSLIQADDGMLYGTTSSGGTSNLGTIFRIGPDGSGLTLLHSFEYGPGGNRPEAGLLQASDGLLYGTTLISGFQEPFQPGVVFRVALDGSDYTVLHSFEGVPRPAPELIEGTDGLLYGVKAGEGPNSGGIAFRMAPDGTAFTVLHSFPDPATSGDGAFPLGSLLQAGDGMLYGTTAAGGASDVGTVFRLAPDGSDYTVLHRFLGGAMDGSMPYPGLIQASDGLLYGTTLAGGTDGFYSWGTIFRIDPGSNSFTLLYAFTDGGTDGQFPYAGLIQGSDGALYGTNFRGPVGDGRNGGTVFRLVP